MAVMELWRRRDLEGTVKPEYIDGNFFTQDSVGNLVGVKCYKDGAEVALTGSVTGYCILPSGETVSVAGTRSGNQASILVPQSALAYTGPLGITLKLIDGNTITTLMRIIVVVYRSKTDTVITPSSQIITDWANQISAALQEVEDASAAQDAKIENLDTRIDVALDTQMKSFYMGSPSGTQLAVVDVNIPSGVYRLTIGRVTSSDTDADVSNIAFYSGGTLVSTISVDRNKEIERTITLTQDIDKLYFYAATTYNNSANDTFTFADMMISAETKLNERLKAAEAMESNFVNMRNVFNKATITSGKYITGNNGIMHDDSGKYTSDYIAVDIDDTLVFPVLVSHYGEANAKQIAVYNSNKEYIGYVTGTLSGNMLTIEISLSAVGVTVTSPDMKYIRTSYNLNDIESYMVIKNSDYPDHYEPFGVKKLSEDFVLNDTQTAQVMQMVGVSGALANKLIAYNGDSICESRLAPGNTYNAGAYAKIIADIVGGTYENRAIGGGILASAPGDGGSIPARCVVSDIENMTDNADLICLEGGINDYWRAVPLGTYSESNYTDAVDTTTLCGALESIFRTSIAKWVGKPIVFVITHKITNTVYAQNSAGYTWMDAHEKIVGICKKYAIPYYDAFEESGLNGYNAVQNAAFLTANSSGAGDGCHPNEAGYRRYYVPQLIALFKSLIPTLTL